MIALKLQPLGDRLGVLLDEAARAELNAQAGDTVYLSRSPPEAREAPAAPQASEAPEQDDGRHARGRAFLKRYQKTLEDLAR